MIKNKKQSNKSGFTLVELVIVVAVIAILAAIGYVAYGGAQDRAREAVLSSDLVSAAELLNVDRVRSGGKSFPADMSDTDNGNGLPASVDTIYYYTVNNLVDPPEFCLTGHNGMIALHITHEGVIKEGVCDGDPEPVAIEGGGSGGAIVDGSLMQEITSANCPTTRTRAVDARDNHTYWVQKLADGKCWMLTNLAYAGGGDNDYGDVVTLTTGGGPSTYTDPKYYIPPGSNATSEPANPSTSTDGAGQYGYLYNWCGAMGGQPTSACSNSTSSTPDTTISVCPAGWRLPTIDLEGGDNEFYNLNLAVNDGSTSTYAGLDSSWLAQRSGIASNGSFYSQGNYGHYWSSAQSSATFSIGLDIGGFFLNSSSGFGKNMGIAVRCVAS